MDMRNKLIREIQNTDQTIERFRSLVAGMFTESPLLMYESISEQITELEEMEDACDMAFCIRTVGVSMVINWVHEVMLKLGEAQTKEKIIEDLADLTDEELDAWGCQYDDDEDEGSQGDSK